MTDINRSNCKKLAAYLLTLPAETESFGMEDFFDGDTDEELLYAETGKHQCGTSACAVGHGPAAGVPVPEDGLCWSSSFSLRHQQWVKTPNWSEYSEKSFISDATHYWWEWCFGGGWGDADDTPQGAAKRIQLMLDYTKEGKELPEYGGDEFCSSRLYDSGVQEFYLALYQ